MSRKNRNFIESALSNEIVFRHYYNRLVELSISMFEYQNLPDSVDPRFLELTLFTNGSAVFFNDEVMGMLSLPVATGGTFDVYRIPNDRRAYASNGYNINLTNDNSVIMYNNYLHTNAVDSVNMFAMRLYDLDRTIDINARAQKTPILLSCNENERLSIVNMYKEYDGNSPVICSDKSINTKGISVLKTDAPYVADKLNELKSQIWNEALTYLGISNTNVTKKERLVSDEVVRNMGGIIASRYSRLESRREALAKINKMFGTDIKVNYRQDYREISTDDMDDGTGEDGIDRDNFESEGE